MNTLRKQKQKNEGEIRMDSLTINISKEYKCDAKTLFTAISEGILFKYTGALMDKLKMDFREGGSLVIDWGDSSMKGEFKAVKPYEKVSFTWNKLFQGA
jgi:uncharacterized protein YndB with AHSA1/START domain